MKKASIFLVAALLAPGCAQAQTLPDVEGEWRAFEPERTNPSLAELGYFYGEDHHAEPYLTCNAGSGWIMISQAMPQDFDGLVRLRAGQHAVDLPAATREDMGVSVEVMVPAEHSILREAALGHDLQIDANRYMAKTGEERSAIRQFIAHCRID